MTELAAAVTVVVHDEVGESEEGGAESDQHWCCVAEQTILGEGVDSGTLDVIFIDRRAMHALNLEHMGVDGPTDVLAFPLDGPDVVPSREGDSEATASPDGGPPQHLGDVVVCPAVAKDQAPEHAGAFDAEMTLLIVHGILHVLGHDHREPAETLVMQSRERHHLARYGFRHPVSP